MECLEYCLMYKFYIYLVFLSGRLLRTFYNKDCIRCGLFLGSLVAIYKVCSLYFCYKKTLSLTTIYWTFKNVCTINKPKCKFLKALLFKLFYYMACVCRWYNVRSDWLIVWLQACVCTIVYKVITSTALALAVFALFLCAM